jgi:hypothetical protein
METRCILSNQDVRSWTQLRYVLTLAFFFSCTQHKKEVRYQNWRCTYCNKVFKSEQFLERHIENRHPYTILKDGVCLADHCDVLMCDLAPLSQDAGGPSEQKMGCNPKLTQRRRHKCQSIIDLCFPPQHSDLANQLHHHFEELYCSHLTCIEIGQRLITGQIPEALRRSSVRNVGYSKEDARMKGWKKLYLVIGVLFGLLLVIFYLGMCLYRKDIGIMSDLRKLSNSKRKKRMELLKAKQI